MRRAERATATDAEGGAGALDVEALRAEFPALHQQVHGKPLVYLDNAATTQKPRSVIDAITHFYERDCSNVHRGVHELSSRATAAYESARDAVAGFVGTDDRREIVFTSGTTGGMNLLAQALAARHLGRGDEVIVSGLEHHSNIVPWQMACERVGAVVRPVPLDDDGVIDQAVYRGLLGPRTRVVAVSHTSNALGTRNPVRAMADAAHRVGALVIVDGAQAMAHRRVDVGELGCDALSFSGHKMYGPFGIGALWARHDLLCELPPVLGGGEMIVDVTFDGTTYREPPARFEAGTPNIVGAVGLGAAVQFLQRVGLDRIAPHEDDLLAYGTGLLSAIDGLRIYGTAADKAAILSFTLAGVHPHDAATALDFEGIAVRAGQHCAQPVMDRYEVTSTLRASLACYTTRSELEALAAAVGKVIEVFR